MKQKTRNVRTKFLFLQFISDSEALERSYKVEKKSKIKKKLRKIYEK